MYGARPLKDAEVVKLLAEGFKGKYANRDKALFAVGVSTGFRISELLSLTMRDVMHRVNVKDYIKVDRRHTKGKLRGRKQKLHSFAKDALQDWIDERLQDNETIELLDQYCFQSRENDTRTGKPKAFSVGHAIRIIKKAGKRAGIGDDLSTHSMRKTSANKVYKDAVKRFQAGETMMEPMRIVQHFLGHKSVEVTMRYLSFVEQDISDEAFQFHDSI